MSSADTDTVQAAAIITLLLVANHVGKQFFCAKDKDGDSKNCSSVTDAMGIAVSYGFLGSGNDLAHLILYVMFGAGRLMETASCHVDMEAVGNFSGYLAYAALFAMTLNGVIGAF